MPTLLQRDENLIVGVFSASAQPYEGTKAFALARMPRVFKPKARFISFSDHSLIP
jgi:hypothetical protein